MQHQHDETGNGSMTPRYDSYGDGGSYADSYATHYSAMSDGAGAADSYATHYGPLTTATSDDDDVGTPPGTGGSFPDSRRVYGGAGAAAGSGDNGDVATFSDAMTQNASMSASSYASFSSDLRFGSNLNVDMNSYASSSALSPRDSDPLGHSAFFGAMPTTNSSSSNGADTPHQQQQQQQYDLHEGSDVATPKSPDSDHHHQQQQIGDNNRGDRTANNSSILSNSNAFPPGAYPQYQQSIGVPLSPGSRHSQHSKLSTLSKSNGTYVSQKAISRESARELAKTALSVRATSVGDVTFEHPNESNLRESIRRVQAYSRRDAPLDYEMSAKVLYKRRPCEIRMDRDVISWYRGTHHKGSIDTDDIVGAEAPVAKPGHFRIHYFKQGRGTGAKALRRKHCFTDFACDDVHVAEKWILTIQELVRWQARAPPLAEKRRIKIVVNPHSGKRRARKIWFEDVKKFFDLGNFEYVVEETTHSGHGIEMGKSYSADDGFEALVFIGGDGTLCEFMNGLLSRPEHEWREIVVSTPISLISAGTQNAFGTGVGIPTVEAAVFCIIKRKIRPLDVITTIAEHEPEKVHYSYCGVGWGVAGDIAAESEKYRWLGTSRYIFLKLKRAVLMPRKHTGRVRYVLTEPQLPLCKYDDIRNVGAQDQFEVEEGNVYDNNMAMLGDRQSSTTRKSWGGFGGAIRSPASNKRYPEAAWQHDEGRYMVVGVVNTAPDGAYAHPSDGNLDLIISRKGNIFRSLQLGVLYLMGKELKSPLITYVKVKAVVIDADQKEDCMNMDGEVLPGGSWRIEVIPSLFKALSEK